MNSRRYDSPFEASEHIQMLCISHDAFNKSVQTLCSRRPINVQVTEGMRRHGV